MSNTSGYVNKIRKTIDSMTAGIVRRGQGIRLERTIRNMEFEVPDPHSVSIALVFLPGSDISEKAISRISQRLSNNYEYKIITFAEKDTDFRTINARIIEADPDYVLFLNNIYSVSRNFDSVLLSTLYKFSDIGIVGALTYYSKKSGRTRSNLVKQVGLSTQKRFEKDGITPYYTLRQKRNEQILWRKSTELFEEIPSTDLLFMSFDKFREFKGIFELYESASLKYPLSDLCLLSIASGCRNYLNTSCVASINTKEKNKAARVHNRNVFRGRWYRYLSSREQPSFAALDGDSIDICGAMPANDSAKFWGDYHYALALKKSFEKLGFKVNVLSKEHWYDNTDSKYVLVLRGVKPYYRSAVADGRIVMFWAISHPADIKPAELSQASHVFFASKKMQEIFGPKISTYSSVLPQCTDQNVMSASGACAMSPELLFVGNSRHVYRRILQDLLPTEHELKVFGRHWEDFPLVYKHVVSEYIDNAKVASAYHNAAILLNDHWDDMLEYGIISNRIFDALCAGAFVISDDVPGIHELLGDAVVTYTDKNDLKDKIDFYVTHPKERNEIASKGQSLVLNKHTFDERVVDIIKVMSQTKV
ncbi:CgeB family protein [Butyrivibrio sp. WCD2001]|uniref:CgeB family protein n=1 Tax=Butyrivibrio sp. WCD2001 TaxID=1280681 RepID=UPI0005D20580|nr:glycosyltransferase [Butyrivibrio sp. WCD2001]